MIAKKTSSSEYEIFDDSNYIGIATNLIDGHWLFKQSEYVYLTCRQLTDIAQILSGLNKENSND